jgi:hypothetical protein
MPDAPELVCGNASRGLDDVCARLRVLCPPSVDAAWHARATLRSAILVLRAAHPALLRPYAPTHATPPDGGHGSAVGAPPAGHPASPLSYLLPAQQTAHLILLLYSPLPWRRTVHVYGRAGHMIVERTLPCTGPDTAWSSRLVRIDNAVKRLGSANACEGRARRYYTWTL